LLRRRRRLRLGRRSLLLCLLGLGLVSGGRRRRGLGGWLWLWLWLRLRVGAAIVEPPFGVEDAVIFRCKLGEQATREIELSVTAGRALVCYNGANLLAIVGDGDLLATDSRWVNRIAPELGTVDSDNKVTGVVPPPAGTEANIVEGHAARAKSLVQGMTLGAFLEVRFSSPSSEREFCEVRTVPMGELLRACDSGENGQREECE